MEKTLGKKPRKPAGSYTTEFSAADASSSIEAGFDNELDAALAGDSSAGPAPVSTSHAQASGPGAAVPQRAAASRKAGAPLAAASGSAKGNRAMVEGKKLDGENSWEQSLRPLNFDDYAGQHKVKEKLKVFVEAAKARGESLDHILLSGPPGLGKTTLATIIANTMGVDIRTTSGPALDKKGDLAAILTGLKPNSVLFIDEIHRLSTVIEEYLYSAMEDFYIDIVTGEGLGARSMKFQLVPFTLIGATTRAGLLNAPFRDRFGIQERLSFYDKATLAIIIARSAALLGTTVTPEGAMEIAKRSRGTPRIANRLLKRVRDYAQVKGNGTIDEKLAMFALDQLEVDHMGLDDMDRRILTLISEKFNGGPVGIETLSAALSEEKDTLEEVYEPFLIQEGLLMKTPRGRTITDLAKKHITS